MKLEARKTSEPAWPALTAKRFRKKMITDLHYDVILDLSQVKNQSFKGFVGIHVKLSDPVLKMRSVIPLDINYNFASGHRLMTVTIDGLAAQEGRDYRLSQQGFRVFLSSRRLSHKIDIHFESQYAAGSRRRGLYKFVDPLDKEIYVQTPANFFFLSEVMPCIDQLNVSGSFNLHIVGRANWSVTSATLMLRSRLRNRRRHFYFEETIRYPASQFVLIAGPFEKWIGPPPVDGQIPLVLHARKSLSQIPQWHDLGFVVRHPKDFDYFRERSSGHLKARPSLAKRFGYLKGGT